MNTSSNIERIEVAPSLFGFPQYLIGSKGLPTTDILPWLQTLRAETKTTNREIAEALGVSKRTVEGWFAGHLPSRLYMDLMPKLYALAYAQPGVRKKTASGKESRSTPSGARRPKKQTPKKGVTKKGGKR